MAARGIRLVLLAVVAALSAVAAASEPSRAAAPTTGYAKPLSLPGIDGARHSLAEWKGQVILLNFWASWCEPCLAEIPDLVAIQQRYGSGGLRIVGVGIDESQKLRNVARTFDINYPVLVSDPEDGGSVMESWGNKTGIVPYTVVIDREGRVAFRHRGPLRRDDIEEVIRPLLGGQPGG